LNLGFRTKWERIFESGKTVVESTMTWGIAEANFGTWKDGFQIGKYESELVV